MCMPSLWKPPLKNPVYAPDIIYVLFSTIYVCVACAYNVEQEKNAEYLKASEFSKIQRLYIIFILGL